MERLKLKYKDAQKALDTLRKIFDEPFSIIIRDAAIQRFEYSFEAFWKFIKEYLKEKEGVIGNSPKTCFREIFSLGYSTEDETVVQAFLRYPSDILNPAEQNTIRVIMKQGPVLMLIRIFSGNNRRQNSA